MNFPRFTPPNPFLAQNQGQIIRGLDIENSRFLSELVTALSNIMEKGIKIDDNLDLCIVTYTSNATPDTEDTITHTLRRVPIGRLVIRQDKAASFYDGGTSWDSAAIYLKCDVASVAATIVIF